MSGHVGSTMTVQQAFDLALRHHQSGQLHEAELIYRQILSQQPNHPGALHLLGVIAHQVGRNEIAVDLIRQALTLVPDWPEACTNLAEVLRAQGQFDQAMVVLQRALALNPRDPAIHINLGNTLKDQGKPDQAIAAFQQAIALKPDSAIAYSNLGIALHEQGHSEQAIAAYQQALSLQPDYPEAHNNLGNALLDTGQPDQSIAAYRRAIALRPNYPEALNNLGSALRQQGRIAEAIAAHRQAIALRPNYTYAHLNLGNALKDMGLLDDAVASYRHVLALSPNFSIAHSNLVYTLHYHPACDASAIAQELHHWNQQHAAPLKREILPHTNDRNPGRRLRIGYLSPDLRQHAVAWFLLPLLENHDRTSFEIFAYAQVRVPDATTQQLRDHVDTWRSIVGLSDAEAADLIRRDGIDILVDLALHTSGNRLLIFARKPAPVQVTYLAYAGSSGLDAMDYRLSDPYLDPPDRDQSVYSERTIRLPHSYWCYRPITDLPIQPPPCIENGYITFGCLNNFCKVNPPLLSLWANLLHAVPRSHLLLHAMEGDHRQQVLDHLQRAGLDPARITFARHLPLDDYFKLYHTIDIALDTHPYGGGTTTCDALWMGVPVVSLAGQTAVGRAGLSILSNLGLPHLVAQSPADYLHIAQTLAHDLPQLQSLRSTLRPRMSTSPLMNAPAFARAVESAYRAMWQTHCAASA